MKNGNLKITVVAAVAAAGLASVSAFAQQAPEAPTSRAERQMGQGTMGQGMAGDGQMMGMMNDPEMRQQMSQMMENCNRMMSRMGNMSPAAGTTRT